MQTESKDLLAGLQRFQSVLGELQSTHSRLEERALRMEKELESSNLRLAAKVEELDRTNKFLEAILLSLPTGVVVRDADNQVVRANRACLEILEGHDEILIGSAKPLPIVGPCQDDQWADLLTKDGTRKTVALRQSQVHDSSGQHLGAVQIIADQTELANATRRMHQQSKMAALGTMAGGIAHEIRNPMNAVRGFAGLLTRPNVKAEDQRRYAQKIEQGVCEVDGIVSGLLNLCNPAGPQKETLTSQTLLQSALDLVVAHEDCSQIDWTCDWQDISFPGDRVQLRQALRNLIANAVQAQDGQGPLQIRCQEEQDAVHFEVHDSGPGMDADGSERCIDPFFTTRADGMGLGLSLVDQIARLHGGSLQVANQPSLLGGACVRLSIPITLPCQAQ